MKRQAGLLAVLVMCYLSASATAQTCSRIPRCATCFNAKTEDGVATTMCRTCELGYRPTADGLKCECSTGYYYRNGTTTANPLQYPPNVTPTATGWSAATGANFWRAKQSSTDFGGLAQRSLDGNTDSNWGGGSCSHTGQQARPWWALDLGQAQDINGLVIWNRVDCCTDRLHMFEIRVGNTDPTDDASIQKNALCTYYEGTAGPERNAFMCRASNGTIQLLKGRYVTIQLVSDSPASIIHICEVQPMITPPPPAGCVPCELGMICPGGNDAPLECPPGMMTLTAGARTTEQCVARPGFGFNKNRTFDAAGKEVVTVSVTPCPPNFFNAGKNQLPCRACPSGLITIPKEDGSGATSVRECIAPAGFAFDKGVAKPCPRGTYKGGASNSNFCTKCPAGLTTNSTGSKNPADCYQALPGSYVETPGVRGRPCPRGSYNGGFNNATECTKCQNDMVTINVGSRSNSSCLVPPGWGFYVDNPPGSKVKICPIGWWKSGFNLKPCVYCGDGLLTKAEGSTASQDCMIPPGYGTKKMTHPNGTNDMILIQCLNGTFGLPVPTFGIQDLPCRPCGENMGTLDMKPNFTGNLSTWTNAGFDACVTLPGYGWDTQYKASKICKEGTYSSGWSLQTCYACDEGQTTAGLGSLTAEACEVAPGFYFDEHGSGDALLCDEGSYCPGFNVTDPLDCPNGTWSLRGAKSIMACDVCIAGHGSWTVGTNGTVPSCSICPPNTYAPKGGVDACANCPAGEFSPAGSDSTADCYEEWQKLKKDFDYLPVPADATFMTSPPGPFDTEESCRALCTSESCVFYVYSLNAKSCSLYNAPAEEDADITKRLGMKVDAGVYTVYASNAAAADIGVAISVAIDGATANFVVTSTPEACMKRCDDVEGCVALLMSRDPSDGNINCALRAGAESADLRSKYKVSDGSSLNKWYPAAAA